MADVAGKLVRDRIPDIIRAKGETPLVRTASEDEYLGLLRAKLREEVREYLASGDPEELADILEVLYALAEQAGLSIEWLDCERARKALKCGGFAGRVVWLGNQAGVGQ